MEDHRSYKVERNRRRWMEGNYENALALEEKIIRSNNTSILSKFGNNLSDESERFSDIKTSESGAFFTSDSFEELPSTEYNRTISFLIENEDKILPEIPGNDKYSSNDSNSLNTPISNLSSRSTKSRSTRIFTGKPRRKRNAINRMSLFECLLETTDPPPSPIKRYGSYTPWSEMSVTTASSLDSRGSKLVQNGLKRWSENSIKRANTGDYI